MTVAEWCYGLLFDDVPLLHSIMVPISSLGLGMLIKYGNAMTRGPSPIR
jgi:hypothetical protein